MHFASNFIFKLFKVFDSNLFPNCHQQITSDARGTNKNILHLRLKPSTHAHAHAHAQKPSLNITTLSFLSPMSFHWGWGKQRNWRREESVFRSRWIRFGLGDLALGWHLCLTWTRLRGGFHLEIGRKLTIGVNEEQLETQKDAIE